MNWPQEELTAAGRILGSAATLREAAEQLRVRYAPMRTTVLDAADLREEPPALRAGRRALFFASNDGHCWRLTQQAEVAQLLILTEE